MSDMKIFDDKSFQDLTRDIYENALNKKNQIEVLIREMNKMITSIDEVVIVAPIIKEYLEVAVKNDEHLVKLANVLQRILTKTSNNTEEDGFGLSDTEKEELMTSLHDTVNELQKENDNLDKLSDKKHAGNI
jgi:hypothetical protein